MHLNRCLHVFASTLRSCVKADFQPISQMMCIILLHPSVIADQTRLNRYNLTREVSLDPALVNDTKLCGVYKLLT